jgi:2-dehydro-3-deoxygalactonokinase
LIGVDWGTSGFRAYRIGADGRILDSRSAPKGILAVPAGGFPAVLEAQVGDWLAQGEAPFVMSGMVGSRQGWVEVPYLSCPAGFDEIASSLVSVGWKNHKAWVVPGLRCDTAVPDVMRGEETQILGAGRDGLVCLPGTHSKWVSVEGGRIVRFSTHMTGEVYAVLKNHSILGRTMEHASLDEAALVQGVNRAGEPGGLLHHLFGVRTRGLMGELSPAASGSYLSGILIGHELRAFEVKSFHILATPELVGLYEQAARLLGIETTRLPPDAAAHGLYRLGAMLAV